MSEKKNISWFKNEIAPNLEDYEIGYRYFEDGDFGSLNQVSFDSKNINGEMDFWGFGWLGIYLWDAIEEVWLLNTLIKPEEQQEQEKAIVEMKRLLKI